jgi:hypothetical protein
MPSATPSPTAAKEGFMREQKTYQVGDIYRLKTSEGFHVWKIVGIHLGATTEENLIGLTILNMKPGTAHGVTISNALVPEPIFAAANPERC